MDRFSEGHPMSVTEIIHPKAKAEQRHMRTLIDGSWVDSLSGPWPAKRNLIATIPRGNVADVAAVVAAGVGAMA
jgi:hypothetical protein